MKTPEPAHRIGQQSLNITIAALQRITGTLGAAFDQAVELIAGHQGKIVVSGVGKSGYVAQKLAASFCSTGTPSVFLNANEAIHGDLGVYQPGDPTILFSKSGATSELVRLLPILKQFKSPLIAIVGNVNAPIALGADIVLDAAVEKESDPLNLVPTASVIVSMGIADAIVSAVMLRRSFNAADFARFHPGGQLGRNLLCTVEDVMQKQSRIALLKPEATLKEAVIAMTQHPTGAACIVDAQDRLVGLLTDGDIRRALIDAQDIQAIAVASVMTRKPITIEQGCLLGQALQIMEGRPEDKQLSVLPVVDASGCLVGLLRIHDVYHV